MHALIASQKAKIQNSLLQRSQVAKRPVFIGEAGFSLIELMIVVAIMGIIAAVGYPSYTSYMERTRRADAKVILSEVASEQQRFFTENNRYAADLAEMGYAGATQDSENGFYNVAVTSSGVNGFLLTATPVAGAAQANDTDCAAFTINSSGAKGVDGGATLTADECW